MSLFNTSNVGVEEVKRLIFSYMFRLSDMFLCISICELKFGDFTSVFSESPRK